MLRSCCRSSIRTQSLFLLETLQFFVLGSAFFFSSVRETSKGPAGWAVGVHGVSSSRLEARCARVIRCVQCAVLFDVFGVRRVL